MRIGPHLGNELLDASRWRLANPFVMKFIQKEANLMLCLRHVSITNPWALMFVTFGKSHTG